MSSITVVAPLANQVSRTQASNPYMVDDCRCGRLKSRPAKQCRECFRLEQLARGRVEQIGWSDRKESVRAARATEAALAACAWVRKEGR